MLVPSYRCITLSTSTSTFGTNSAARTLAVSSAQHTVSREQKPSQEDTHPQLMLAACFRVFQLRLQEAPSFLLLIIASTLLRL